VVNEYKSKYGIEVLHGSLHSNRALKRYYWKQNYVGNYCRVTIHMQR